MSNKPVKKRNAKNLAVAKNGELIVEKRLVRAGGINANQKVAYRVSAEIFETWLNNYVTIDAAHAAFSGVPPSEFLQNDVPEMIGLRFEFVKGESCPTSFLNIWQVYYVRSLNAFFKIQPEGFGAENFVKKLDGTYVFDIDSGETDRLKDEPSEGKCFEQLDVYDRRSTEIDFVYFTKDQLSHMVRYYKETEGHMIISGSELRLARKLSHREGGAKTYKASYFTLKIEGQEGDATFLTTEGENYHPLFIESGDVAVGHPCPPDWYLFRIMLNQAATINPEVNTTQLAQTWKWFVAGDKLPAEIKKC